MIKMTKSGYKDISVYYCGACRIVFEYQRSSFDRGYYKGYVSVKDRDKRYRWDFSDLSPSPMGNNEKSIAEDAMVFLTCGYNEKGKEKIYPDRVIQDIFQMNMDYDKGEPKITRNNPWRKRK